MDRSLLVGVAHRLPAGDEVLDFLLGTNKPRRHPRGVLWAHRPCFVFDKHGLIRLVRNLLLRDLLPRPWRLIFFQISALAGQEIFYFSCSFRLIN